MAPAGHGVIAVGAPADLVLFRARSLNELLSRSQHDRCVIRAGLAIAAAIPPYEDLDDLVGPVGPVGPPAPRAAPKAPTVGVVDMTLWRTDKAACVAQASALPLAYATRHRAPHL